MLISLYPFLIPAALIVFVFFTQFALRKHYDYKCGNCGHAFTPPMLAMVFTPHQFGTKLLKCPKCGKWTWAVRVPKNSEV